MTRYFLSLTVLAACLMSCLAEPSPAPSTVLPSKPTASSSQSQPIQNAILIGWDGCHRDHVKALLKAGKLPNLKKVIDEGSLVDIDIREVTETKPGWTQVLTGYAASITGVYTNDRYQPIPKGYTIFERLQDKFGRDRIATVAVIGKKNDLDTDEPKKFTPQEWSGLPRSMQPAGAKLVDENGQRFWLAGGKPYCYLCKELDLFANGLTANQKVGDRALEMLDTYKDKRFFFFVHFAEIDANGHRYGERSSQYNDAIVSCDAELGRIVKKLDDLGIYGKTRIYITADHGFDLGAKTHHNAPYIFLATNDPAVIRGGTRADIGPTIMDRFGLDLSKIEPKLTGESLARPSTQPGKTIPAASRPAVSQPVGS